MVVVDGFEISGVRLSVLGAWEEILICSRDAEVGVAWEFSVMKGAMIMI